MNDQLFSIVTGIVSATVACGSFFFAWRNFRENTLRRGDVLIWANEVIKELESLLLICRHSDHPYFSEETVKARMVEIIFNTATLAERGRLFFRNEVTGDGHGADKEPAYRGYRPVILDPIVTAHQIARHWVENADDSRLRMRVIAEDCLKKFVSLAQDEVGRSRTRSRGASTAGEGRNLRLMLPEIDAARLEAARR